MLDCFQMSFTPGPHNHQKASLDIISLLQVWSLLCIAQLSENSLVVRNIFVKNLDDRIKLFVILGPDRWWCCWQSITPGYNHTLPSFPIMNIFQYAPTYWYLWHSSVIFIQVWCFFKRASEYIHVAYVTYSLQCHITIKRFPHQRQNLFSKFFFFNISFFIGFDLGWKDGRDAHIDDHPVADNEDFPVFPQLRAIWLPKQCNVTAGSTSWLNSKFLPNNLRTTGVIANPAPSQFFFDALIAPAPSL